MSSSTSSGTFRFRQFFDRVGIGDDVFQIEHEYTFTDC